MGNGFRSFTPVGYLGAFVILTSAAFGMGHLVLTQRDEARADLAAAEEAKAELDEELRLARSSGAELATKVTWRKRKLMGGTEFRVYCALAKIVAASPYGHRLFSQVGFGGFLEVPPPAMKDMESKAAFHAVARKRADFLITDHRGFPVAVIEYQGAGHFRGNADDRDQAKRVACRRAGIAFIDVPADGLTRGQQTDLRSLLSPVRAKIAAE